LDTSVQDGTENRKAENADYKATMAANKAAKELIGVAKKQDDAVLQPCSLCPSKKN